MQQKLVVIEVTSRAFTLILTQYLLHFQQKLLMDANGTSAIAGEAAGESIYVTVLEALLLWLICTIGIASNLLAFFVLSRHRAFKSSFGQLAACYAFGNAGVLIIMVLWAVPWTIWEIPSGLQYINLRMGQLSFFFYEATNHCVLFISVNRLSFSIIQMKYKNSNILKNA
ncbi:hypothetical protein GCK32_001936 [Trichostrongylus colubriformis]|uniref:7TM GPCR serpentine receptor class x (Srx) domain-containing protein n=1 Tax=Trichostrongylus colubriformis TaxID=6319 RepID=A0AAN8G6H5_TRICO